MQTLPLTNQRLAFPVAIGLLFLAITQLSGCEASAPESLPNVFQEIVRSQTVRSLPGRLDTIPVFNSNSPEWVKTEGILLSTFPPNGKQVPTAHLNFPLQGRFDLFVQHYTYAPKDLQMLYQGLILHNPGEQPITVKVLQAASYSMQEAPWKGSAPYVDNPDNTVYGGPGDRAVNDVFLGKRNADFPAFLVIPPGESQLLMNHPIPVKSQGLPMNGRSTLIRVLSSGTVYAASLAMFAKKNPDGSDRAPTLSEWEALLNTGGLAGPRDLPPTPPTQTSGKLIYSRVAGVSQGSQWQASLVDRLGATDLTIPQRGQAVSFALDTLRAGQLGTEQVQTAKMLVHYPDTAYEAHGNYGVEYNLSLPLHNTTNQPQTVALTIETPMRDDKLKQGGLRFFQPSPELSFFRGTVRLHYIDDQGQQQTRYVHLSHRTGQLLPPLLKLMMPPASHRQVQIDFIYPPDSMPPQVLTVSTLSQ